MATVLDIRPIYYWFMTQTSTLLFSKKSYRGSRQQNHSFHLSTFRSPVYTFHSILLYPRFTPGFQKESNKSLSRHIIKQTYIHSHIWDQKLFITCIYWLQYPQYSTQKSMIFKCFCLMPRNVLGQVHYKTFISLGIFQLLWTYLYHRLIPQNFRFKCKFIAQ